MCDIRVFRNVFIYAVKTGFVELMCMWFPVLLDPASSGHLKNCSFYHFQIGFVFFNWWLLLGAAAYLACACVLYFGGAP